jgi:hypothetical protein
MQDQIFQFCSQPQLGGGGMPIFMGARHPGMLVGGGFFSTLARFALPLLKNIGGRALRVAACTATHVIDQRRPLGDSLMQNTLQEVKSAFQKPSDATINKVGGGARRKRKQQQPTSDFFYFTKEEEEKMNYPCVKSELALFDPP